MNTPNLIEFDVENVGHFKMLKEATAQSFVFNQRNELAKLCGGRVELAHIESTISAFNGSSNPVEQETAFRLVAELMKAKTFLEMKSLALEVPQGFRFESISDDQFEKVRAAYDKAMFPFRQGTEEAAPAVTPAVKPPEQKKPD